MSARAPLTRQQLLFLNAILLLGLALLMNRDRLPPQMLPEYNDWLGRPGASALQSLVAKHGSLPESMVPLYEWFERLPPPQGRLPLLVVGDSEIMRWPWEADIICVPGGTSSRVLREFQHRVAGRHYEQIILRIGTHHLAKEATVETLVDDVCASVEVAVAHANTVVVIGPMPRSDGEDQWWYHRVQHNDTWDRVDATMAALEGRLGDVPLIDTRQWRTEFSGNRYLDTYTIDRVHLTDAGFAALAPLLERWGIRLTPAAARQP